jgi:hypothetical protein
MLRRLAPGLAVLLLVLAGCRDEQAGPRPKGAPQGGPQGGQAPSGLRVIDAAPANLTYRQSATWADGAVEYLGSIVEPAAPQPGQQVRLVHFFRATRPVPAGYKFFVHVIDAASHQQLANLDHEIQGGAGPLGTWPVGKVVPDEHGFTMPNYPGTLRLLFGFWNAQGRLKVDDSKTDDGESRVVGPSFAPVPQAPLPEYHTPRAARAPVIDGKLDDEVWKQAPEQELVASFDGHAVTRKTTFRVLWDDEFIYVGFFAVDPDVWGTLMKKDDPIYNEEVCEVFFDADGDGKTYNELQVSPHNVNFDASFVARRSNLEAAMKWESGMTTAVFVKGTLDDDQPDEFWSAEMKIPIKNLTAVPHVPPLKGDRWRFNAYRLEHLVHRQQIEGQAFSPLFQGDFHNLPRFGWLVFE